MLPPIHSLSRRSDRFLGDTPHHSGFWQWAMGIASHAAPNMASKATTQGIHLNTPTTECTSYLPAAAGRPDDASSRKSMDVCDDYQEIAQSRAEIKPACCELGRGRGTRATILVNGHTEVCLSPARSMIVDRLPLQ